MMMGLDATTELKEHVGYAARLRAMIANQPDRDERAKLEIMVCHIEKRIQTLTRPRLPPANNMAGSEGADVCAVQ